MLHIAVYQARRPTCSFRASLLYFSWRRRTRPARARQWCRSADLQRHVADPECSIYDPMLTHILYAVGTVPIQFVCCDQRSTLNQMLTQSLAALNTGGVPLCQRWPGPPGHQHALSSWYCNDMQNYTFQGQILHSLCIAYRTLKLRPFILIAVRLIISFVLFMNMDFQRTILGLQELDAPCTGRRPPYHFRAGCLQKGPKLRDWSHRAFQ